MNGEAVRPHKAPYEVRIERDVPATMRDGTVLRADVVWPVARHPDERFPVLLTRTPYQKRPVTRLAEAGYITVSQDVRGRYASEGEYRRMSPLDGRDGYDTVLWAAGLPGATGKVGVWGSSYSAWEAWALAMERPAPLAAMAVSGMAVTSTSVEGVPRPGRRLQWFYSTGAPPARQREAIPGPQTRAAAEQLWAYERGKWLWFLPWRDLPEHAFGPLTGELKDWFERAAQDHYGFAGRHGQVEVPVFHRTGWYDRFVLTVDHFTAMLQEGRTEEIRRAQRLVIGPWGHTNTLTRNVGEIDFGPSAELDDTTLLLRWFDYWLKGEPNGALDEPPVRYFLMGRNEWRGAAAWPPPESRMQDWYLRSGGRANSAYGNGAISPEPPSASDAPADEYDYDPRDPVPTIWPLHDQCEPLDQRPNDPRPDLLVYVSTPFAQPLAIAGDPEVVLHAACSALDTDFVARLADAGPDGYVQPLCYGIVRARYREGYDRPRLLTPGDVVEYHIRLQPIGHCFLPGHRLRLEITSSDFPNYDRNHNTGADDFSDPTLMVAHQTIFHTPERPSRVRLPVVPADRA